MSSEPFTEVAARLVATEDPEVLARLIDRLEAGELILNATAARLQRHLALPMGRIDAFQRLFSSAGELTPADLARILRMGIATRTQMSLANSRIEIAVTHSSLVQRVRTTGGVARDIINGAAKSLLVVGYSVTTDDEMVGLAGRTVTALGDAAARGVHVTAVLHFRHANRTALLRGWRSGAGSPQIYTWPAQPDDPMASMHAKVLVADRMDALVTSANLTYHGLERNVEMGVRIQGDHATTVADVFETLIRSGEFVEWPP